MTTTPTPNECWFCGSTVELRERTRSYDSAPLGGFECEECHQESINHRKRCEAEYAAMAERAQRIADAREGFDE